MIEPLKIQVRYGDLDVMNHVNNSIYLSYFEMARVYYFAELLGKNWDWESDGVLVVKNEVEYLAPILLTDKPVIEMWCDSIGTKSFGLAYRIKVEGKIYTTGKTIMVSFDAAQNKTVPIHPQMKLALEKLKEYV